MKTRQNAKRSKCKVRPTKPGKRSTVRVYTLTDTALKLARLPAAASVSLEQIQADARTLSADPLPASVRLLAKRYRVKPVPAGGSRGSAAGLRPTRAADRARLPGGMFLVA